ncbi:MAG: hypothetical protein HY854_09050 [Burkholderiales bacterium]|nr:hypothetical protein [Burkholderiales bacterium]
MTWHKEFEKVTVRAGTFDSFRVVCTAPGSVDTMWSSVDMGMWIKADLRRSAEHFAGAGTQQHELLAVNLRK